MLLCGFHEQKRDKNLLREKSRKVGMSLSKYDGASALWHIHVLKINNIEHDIRYVCSLLLQPQFNLQEFQE